MTMETTRAISASVFEEAALALRERTDAVRASITLRQKARLGEGNTQAMFIRIELLS